MLLEEGDQYTPRFAIRLYFDKSPYPPRHEWKEPRGGTRRNEDVGIEGFL